MKLGFCLAIAVLLYGGPVTAQVFTQRGFVEGRGDGFAQETANDQTRVVADLHVREDVGAKPSPWLQFAVGVEARANSHDQVDNTWRIDLSDRGARRPALSLRRATATMTAGRFTVDVGKQFIRWGRADILNPTDHFAPRDYLSVVDTEFLGVTGVRVVGSAGREDTVEGVWLPRFTPSRLPLLTQRWTAVPADGFPVELVDAGAVLPGGAQTGLRWNHVGTRLEYSLSVFEGLNNLPNIAVAVVPPSPAAARAESAQVLIQRRYPEIWSYGGDAALPLPWLTLKAEAAYYASSDPETDEYLLYVIQAERQTGEWALMAGYAGEVVTETRSTLTFAPDRGLTKSVIGRASYTLDANRSLAFETAVRQNAKGAYGKAEYSQAYGQHWRATMAGVIMGGEQSDFLGQYRRNSHVSLTLRYSF